MSNSRGAARPVKSAAAPKPQPKPSTTKPGKPGK